MQFAAELQMAELVPQKGSTLQRRQQTLWVAKPKTASPEPTARVTAGKK